MAVFFSVPKLVICEFLLHFSGNCHPEEEPGRHRHPRPQDLQRLCPAEVAGPAPGEPRLVLQERAGPGQRVFEAAADGAGQGPAAGELCPDPGLSRPRV